MSLAAESSGGDRPGRDSRSASSAERPAFSAISRMAPSFMFVAISPGDTAWMRMFRGRSCSRATRTSPRTPPLLDPYGRGSTAAQHAGTGYDEQHHAPTRLQQQGNGVL